MKKFKAKMLGVIIALILVAILMPTKVLGANEELQMVYTDNGDYIIYVKGLANKEFDFAISEKSNAEEIDLNYINSVTDKEGNHVVLITKDKYEIMKDKENYLYIKNGTEIICTGEKINFAEAFDQQKMAEVEKTTKRINTEVISDIIEKDEEIDGVKVKVTVGGLKITDAENSKYYYTSTKLPATQYSELSELGNKINNEYNDMDMYTKIETAKEFYNLYTELANKQNWAEVKDMTIMQPEDAQKGDQYVVYLKKVDENGNETIDIKLMIADRKEEQGKDQIEETKIVQETAKLPITGDSIVLFVVLAVIVLAAIIIFIRMKKIQNNKEEK